MFRKTLLSLAIVSISAGTTAGLARADELPVDSAGTAHLTLYDTHDLVLLSVASNHVTVTVMMFQATEFDSVPQDPYLTFEDLAALAGRVLHYASPLSDVDCLMIECGAGNDVVATSFNFPVPLVLSGDDGDDYLQGGASADILSGGNGDDWLDGFGDGRQDTLKGGDDCDTFVQYYRLVRGTRYGTVRIAEERLLDVTVKDDVVENYGE